jgi:peptidoglycan-associated lipoprotein
MSYHKMFVILLFSTFLTGCSSSISVPDPEPTNTTYGGSSDNANVYDEADTFGTSSDGIIGGEYIGEAAEVLENVIYFDFDSSEVPAENQELISRHAGQLSLNSFRNVRLEGHADEQGSREYNIGLGERRAQAVRQMLMIQGVDVSQIQTVSFGEERPESMGDSEDAYAQNRRVEIKYMN